MTNPFVYGSNLESLDLEILVGSTWQIASANPIFPEFDQCFISMLVANQGAVLLCGTASICFLDLVDVSA